MTTIIKQILNKEDTNEGTGGVVDERNVERINEWTAIVQLAADPSKSEKRMVADLNTNYVNSHIHNEHMAVTPNSSAGMARIIIPNSTTNNNLTTVLKKEPFAVRVEARRSGGGSKGTSRGAR